MDDNRKTNPAAKEKQSERPPVEEQDLATQRKNTNHAAFNDFMLRLDQLKGRHPKWCDARNQQRPFKRSFLAFAKQLVLRLPVAPEMTPMTNGTIRLRYVKRAPRDKWQSMEFFLYPDRHFEMTATSRLANEKPFKRINMARADYVSDMVRSFFELDSVNTKEHPIRYRSATAVDYATIAGMCQTTFGTWPKYHPRRIAELCKYCVVADDPIYGIVSVAAIKESTDSRAQLEVSFMITVANYRGLGLASKCLQKATANALLDNPEVKIHATSIMRDTDKTDSCSTVYKRAGYRKIRIIRGHRRFTNFECDRCNLCNGNCDLEDPASVCSTVFYVLMDRGGKEAYKSRSYTK